MFHALFACMLPYAGAMYRPKMHSCVSREKNGNLPKRKQLCSNIFSGRPVGSKDNIKDKLLSKNLPLIMVFCRKFLCGG